MDCRAARPARASGGRSSASASPTGCASTRARLSGGQRRRVEIARALVHRPKLLLLDEPTVGLDVASRQFLLDHVRMLCREEGLAALWATHLIDEVDSAARVIVLHQGRILDQGPVPEVIRRANAGSMREAFDKLTGERGRMKPVHYYRCLRGIVWREALRFLNQRGRFLAALVRPLVWLLIFATGFRFVLGVSIIPPYETYIPYRCTSRPA